MKLIIQYLLIFENCDIIEILKDETLMPMSNFDSLITLQTCIILVIY